MTPIQTSYNACSETFTIKRGVEEMHFNILELKALGVELVFLLRGINNPEERVLQ